jgi:hypothetical protein
MFRLAVALIAVLSSGLSAASDFGPVRISIVGGGDSLFPQKYFNDLESRVKVVAGSYRSFLLTRGLPAQEPGLTWKNQPVKSLNPGGGLDIGVMVTDNASAVFRFSINSVSEVVRDMQMICGPGKSAYMNYAANMHALNYMGGVLLESGHDGKEGLAWHLGAYGGLSSLLVKEYLVCEVNDTPQTFFRQTLNVTSSAPVFELEGGADYWIWTGFGLTFNAGIHRAYFTDYKYSVIEDFNFDGIKDHAVGDKADIAAIDLSGLWAKVGIKFLIGQPRRPREEYRETSQNKQVKHTGEKVNIAVATLEPQGVSAADAAVISDRLRSEMVKTGAFNVVEKQNMEKILSEHAFQQTGCTSQECAVKLGRILNVKKMVVGSFGQLMGKHFISVRVIDVETGSADFSEDASGANVDEIMAGTRRIAESMAVNLGNQ